MKKYYLKKHSKNKLERKWELRDAMFYSFLGKMKAFFSTSELNITLAKTKFRSTTRRAATMFLQMLVGFAFFDDSKAFSQ